MTGIQLNADYDLLIKNGGLNVGETTYQNQALLLALDKGEIKEHPLVGVGLKNITNDHEFGWWKREITDQFEQDGQLIKKLEITSQGLTLEAQYK